MLTQQKYLSSAISATISGTKMYAPPPAMPPSSLDAYKYDTSSATSSSDQLIICGTANSNRNVLRPTALAITPNISVPRKPPMQNSDTIHEISSVVRAPSSIGVISSDFSVLKLTDGQPHDVP